MYFLKIYCLSMSHCGALPVVEAQCSGSLTISSHRSHVKFSGALTASDSKQSLGRRAWESHLSRFWAHNPYLLTHEKTTQTTAPKICIPATRLFWSTLANFCGSSFARSGWISFKSHLHQPFWWGQNHLLKFYARKTAFSPKKVDINVYIMS